MNKEQIKAEQDKYNSEIHWQNNKIKQFTDDLQKAQATLELIHSNICFFQFDNHEEAEDTIKEALHNKAHNDCEGSYNRGNDEYTQEYQLIDSDAVYLGKIEVEYNRHDKTYYFVDEVEYSFSEVQPE